MRRCARMAGVLLLLCALAMSYQLKEQLASLMQESMASIDVFSNGKRKTVELSLDELTMYALQLGVFDSEQRALSEQARLMSQGTACTVWQRDKLRLICSVAASREALDYQAAGENEAYVVRDTLPKIALRVSCEANACDEAAQFIALPDTLLKAMLSTDETGLENLLVKARKCAQKALGAHPEHALYTGMAHLLLDWCAAVEAVHDQPSAMCYATVTLCSLCREWRNALLSDYALSAQSTASAQRTPSTAAEVMPPA